MREWGGGGGINRWVEVTRGRGWPAGAVREPDSAMAAAASRARGGEGRGVGRRPGWAPARSGARSFF